MPPCFVLGLSRFGRLVLGAVLAGFPCLRSLGFVMPSVVSGSLVLFSCLGLLCACGAALSGAALLPLFLSLFFFVGVLVWVVVDAI